MADIYDKILDVIDELYDDDYGFYYKYNLNPKLVRGEIIKRMNPVPIDIVAVLDKFYSDLRKRFKDNGGKLA